MRIMAYFLSFLFSSQAFCYQSDVCELEPYLIKNKGYKLYSLSNMENSIDSEDNVLTLLPEFFISINQYSNNERSFKSIGNSSLYVGMSQQVYQGGVYQKTKKNLEISEKYKKSVFIGNVNKLLLELFSDVTEYEYKLDRLSIYKNQLRRQTSDIKRIMMEIDSGNAARIDLDIARLRADNINLNISKITSEIKMQESDIYMKYGIPSDAIHNVTSKTIVKCKSGSYPKNLSEIHNLQIQQAIANKDVSDASSYPSLSVSLSLSPPETGILNDFTTKKVDFGASINLSVPLNRSLVQKNSQRRLAIEKEKIELDFDEKLKEGEKERKNVENKVALLKQSLAYGRKAIAVENKKIEYILSRIKSGRDTLISYYEQIESLDNIEVNVKKDERDLEFEKVHLYFLH